MIDDLEYALSAIEIIARAERFLLRPGTTINLATFGRRSFELLKLPDSDPSAMQFEAWFGPLHMVQSYVKQGFPVYQGSDALRNGGNDFEWGVGAARVLELAHLKRRPWNRLGFRFDAWKARQERLFPNSHQWLWSWTGRVLAYAAGVITTLIVARSCWDA